MNDSGFLCDIVVPIWNQPELTSRCLESVLRCTSEPVRLVLVDNGSRPPTRALLERFRETSRVPVEILRNADNLGFIKAVNQGIRAGSSQWVCLLNNDTVVNTGWLAEMIRVGEKDPSIGLINPSSNSLGFQPPASLPLEEYIQDLRKMTGQAAPLSTALGFCLLARRSFFEQVGLLDETFGMGYFDDDDLSRRARKFGFQCVRACAAYVHHEEKGSFRHLAGTKEAFRENRRRFEERWGRKLRILWIFPGIFPSPAERFKKICLQFIGEGHWLYFLGPEGLLPPEVIAQAQVTFRKTTRRPWRLQAVGWLLCRRKKPFDLAISFDECCSSWIQRVRWLHRTVLMRSPSAEEVVQQCQLLSSATSSC